MAFSILFYVRLATHTVSSRIRTQLNGEIQFKKRARCAAGLGRSRGVLKRDRDVSPSGFEAAEPNRNEAEPLIVWRIVHCF